MNRTLQSYFRTSVSADAARPALHVGEKYYSYHDLNQAAQRVSKFLRSILPCNVQHCVGVLCEKSLTAYAGLLGAMDSGNIYVPLNPKLPINRLEYIANLAQLKALIVDSRSVPKAAQLLELLGKELPIFLPDNDNLPPEFQKYTVISQTPGHETATSPPVTTKSLDDGPHYAYLLFTSGTTGNPKGVPVTHANAAACIEAVCQRFDFHDTDRFTQFSELSFDVSIADIFLCFKAGACLYIPSFPELMMPVEFTSRHKLTVWSSVPTIANNVRALGALKADALASLRLSYFCGEALHSALAKDWQAAAPSGVVVNFYGPTEAAIFSTFYVYNPHNPPSEEIVPLGQPLSGFEYRILKEDVASGDNDAGTGELLLSGPQVVTGYWNNEVATKKAFVHLPEGPAGRVWYRTGDRVGLSDSNDLLFHGRCDRQVKMRGYRIELDEIEAVIRRVTNADLVAVIPVFAKDGRCEDIVAFCDSDFETEDDIKRQCGAYLPTYMVPRRIIRLAEFPRSTNGKLDYRLLAGYLDGSPPAPKQKQTA